MGRSVDDLKEDGEIQASVFAVEFVRLIDGHLRILVAVNENEWGILSVDVENRASQLGGLGSFVGLAAEQKFECGNSHAQTVRGRLGEDGGQIAGAVVAHDSVNVRRLVEMIAHGAFEFWVAVGGAYQGDEMTSCRGACDGQSFCVEIERVRVGSQVANGGFDIMDLRGEGRYWCQAVINAGDGIPGFQEIENGNRLSTSASPSASVHPDDGFRARRGVGVVEIKVQRLSVDLGKLEVFALLGCHETWARPCEGKH